MQLLAADYPLLNVVLSIIEDIQTEQDRLIQLRPRLEP